MATVYQWKPGFQNLLRPVARLLWRSGVTANQVTIAAVVLSVATGVVVALVPGPRVLLWLPAVLLVRMALNAIDGMLAREFGMATRLGAILNELGDVVSDAALYLPLAQGRGFPPALLTLVVIVGIVSEMTGVLGLMVASTRRYEGPMGKSDRAVAFGAMALALGCGAGTGVWQTAALSVVLLLQVATIRSRTRMALTEAA